MNQQKFNHAEAFSWMYYTNRDGTIGKWIFNSRDGVTPFITILNGVEITHKSWQKDVHEPNYKPVPGDFVWRTVTKEEAENIIRKRIESAPKYAPNDVDAFIKNYGEEALKNGEPVLAVVSETGEFVKYHK